MTPQTKQPEEKRTARPLDGETQVERLQEINMMSMAHTIPEHTPPPTLRRLLARYADPQLPMPTRYRVVMLARIVALLLVAAHHDGECAS